MILDTVGAIVEKYGEIWTEILVEYKEFIFSVSRIGLFDVALLY